MQRFDHWNEPRCTVRPMDNTLKALDFSAKICGRTAIVADGSNVFQAGRDRDFRVDYTAVRQFLSGDALVSATFVGSRSTHFRVQQAAFEAYLRRAGWTVHSFRLMSDGVSVSEDESAVDGDVRAEIRKAGARADIDSVVLLSGDGGMTNAVRDARRGGKRVFVVAWDGSLHPALAAAASRVALLDDLAPLLARFH